MAEVRLRPWRLQDADDVAVMIDDEYLRPWSAMGADLDSWIRREVAEARGPSRAVCLPDDDRALGRVAVRLPQFASEAVRRLRRGPCGTVHCPRRLKTVGWSIVAAAAGTGDLFCDVVCCGRGVRLGLLETDRGVLRDVCH